MFHPSFTSLFSCPGCNLCCYAWCCPCCLWGDIAADSNQSYCLNCCVSCFFFLAPFIWATTNENFARHYNIAGDNSCMVPCLCMCFLPCTACCYSIRAANHVQAVKAGRVAGPNSPTIIVGVPVQQIMVASPAQYALPPPPPPSVQPAAYQGV